MSFLNNFKIIKKIKLQGAYERLAEKSKQDFLSGFLSFAGLATCVLGLSINSLPVIIGSMIISPLIYSVLIIPAAIVWQDKKTALIRLENLLLEVLVGVGICAALSYVLKIDIMAIELISKLGPNILIYFLVAVIAGIAAALSFFGPDVSEKITGVAVSVALVPPIAIIGIALENQNQAVLLNAGANLFFNLIGIIIGAFAALLVVKNQQIKIH